MSEDLVMMILDKLSDLQANVAGLDVKIDGVKEDITTVKDYQEKQNGRVFALADKVSTIDKQLDRQKTARRIYMSIGSFVMVVLGWLFHILK